MKAFTHAVRLLKFLVKFFPGACAVVDLPKACAIIESSWRLCTVVPDYGRGPYVSPSSLTQAGAAVDNAGLIPKPEPTMSIARNTVDPTPSLSPQLHRPPHDRKAALYIFICHFGPTNLDFDMQHCHIALICYIATLL
jgi:hypothetical protein